MSDDIRCIRVRRTIRSQSSVGKFFWSMSGTASNGAAASFGCSIESLDGSRNLTWDGRVDRCGGSCAARISTAITDGWSDAWSTSGDSFVGDLFRADGSMCDRNVAFCTSASSFWYILVCMAAMSASIRLGSWSLAIDDANGKEFSASSRWGSAISADGSKRVGGGGTDRRDLSVCLLFFAWLLIQSTVLSHLSDESRKTNLASFFN